MTTVKHRASTILNAFEEAQSELIGKAVILTDGKAGTVEAIWLDELHGMRISIKGQLESGLSRLSNSRRGNWWPARSKRVWRCDIGQPTDRAHLHSRIQ